VFDYIITNVLEVYVNTGVQQAINEAVFGALNMITVFPVEDERKLTDRNGNVLPDAILIKRGSTPKDLAAVIHSDLAKGFLYAIDARKKIRVGENYQLQDRDVIKIVSILAHG
jgi:ribosome-binding ATPase YchF (GTP1/OBG family)